MSQHYSDPDRAEDPYALPDVEVFYMSQGEIDDLARDCEDTELQEQGWYFWACFPGCLPDSDPAGPYATEQLAIDAAREE
jgi:hypothetical protein